MALEFGVGTLQISATGQTYAIGKLQNVKLNISYTPHQLRGGLDIFPTDTQFSDGAVEGSFEFANIELSQIGRMLIGSGAFAGAAGSGTLTVSGITTYKRRFTIILSAVTNGVTGQIKLEKVFAPSLALDFGRTDYTVPSMNFFCEAETGGNVLTWIQ